VNSLLNKKRNYKDESERLAKAIDIAIESFQKYTPKGFDNGHVEHFVNQYKATKSSCLNPESQYANLKSLKYSQQDVFTYFQESSGDTVEYFWEKVKEAMLLPRQKRIEHFVTTKCYENQEVINW
jgi:hypothetical protein